MKRLYALLLFLTFTFSTFGVLVTTTPVYGATDGNLFSDVCSNPKNQKAGDSTVCQSQGSIDKRNPLFGVDGVMTKLVNILSIIVGVIAVFSIMYAGLKMVTSGSNPQDVTKAREMIIYALVGIVIALLAQAIVQLVLRKLD